VIEAPVRAAAQPLPATPYVGLVPYGEEDAPFFFGRDEEERIIAGNLRASRLTILYGPSGVGKTSLLQAGVIRGLREQVLAKAGSERAPFAICPFGAWRDDPLPALVEAIRASAVEASGGAELPPWRPGEPLVDTLRAWTERVRTLLVVLDQFEDYFLYHADEDGEGTFASEFPRIVNEPNLRVNFVLSIREDAWAKLDRFEGHIPRLFANYLRVEHLRPEAAWEAIEGPVAEWNRRLPTEEPPYAVEEALGRAVIDATAAGRLKLAEGANGATPDSAGTDAIEAPFLQLVMERLWRSTVDAGSRELTLARLAELGGAERIVETHLHEALGGLTPTEQQVTADVFRYLVTRSKTKIAHSASDLAEWTKRPAPEVSPVLEKLCRGESGRILRPVPPPDESESMRYELFHDMLAEPILDWRRVYEQRRARRRWARAGAGLLALVAIFAALGAWALVQRNHARSAADSARSATRSAGSLAAAAKANDPNTALDLSLLLSFEGYRANPSFQVRSSMVAALEAAQSSGVVVIFRGHTDSVTAVAFSPDRRTVASASADGTIGLWDARDHRRLGVLRGHTDAVTAVAYAADGRTIASASADGSVRLWDARDHRPLGLLRGHTGPVTGVAFDPAGRRVASAGEDATVRLWDVRARRQIGEPLRGHIGPVLGVAFGPDGRTLATGGEDAMVRLWDADSHEPVGQPFHHDAGYGVDGVAFSPGGRRLASAGLDGTVRVWDLPRHRVQTVLRGHTNWVLGVAFSPGGRTLASVSADGTVRLWDPAYGGPIGQPRRGHTGSVHGVAFSPDGHTLASAGADHTVRLWDVRGPEFEQDGYVSSIAFSSDGHTVASAGGQYTDFAVRLWDARSRTSLPKVLRGHERRVLGVAFSPDGRMVASASADGTVRLWDVGNPRQPESVLRGHTDWVSGVAFSPDGRTLASASADDTVRLWDVRSGQTAGTVLRGHTNDVSAVAFSPDGRTLASASGDGTVRLWDVRTHRQLSSVLRGHTDYVAGVAFSPDGRTIASVSWDGTVRLWDARSRRPLGEPLRGHTGAVKGVAFSPDGHTLASAGDDSTVRLWDVASKRQLGRPLRHESGYYVNSVAFSPDGRTLASGGDDYTVRLWENILWRNDAELRADVCNLVVGNLTKGEWAQYAPGLPHLATCSS
jgi:WD40 repeat protein